MHADLAALEREFSGQFRHSPRPPSLYCPSPHVTHAVSMPLPQGDTYPLPTAHDEHGMHADLASFEISFSGQSSQKTAPPIEYCAAAQFAALIERAMQNVPGPQAVCDEVLLQNEPAEQSVSTTERGGQYEPNLHKIFVRGFSQNEPAGQPVSAVDPAAQYEPALQ